MRFVDEYRDAGQTHKLADAITRLVTQPWTLMEICGGQTHAILKFGLDRLLPRKVTLVHGPGCPVCVTPVGLIDQAIALAQDPKVILCSFGDMLRVPGSKTDLLRVKAQGGDVRIVYSPLDAVELAEEEPDREVVFFAVGFETTAPANAMAVVQAQARGVKNFSLLSAQVLVIPAMEAILSAPGNRVQGFLAAGHVCTVTGFGDYHDVAARHEVPIVITGFEPVDILQGVYRCLQQLENETHKVENAYARAVKEEGNTAARKTMAQVFTVVDRTWRGLGKVPQSGLGLAPGYARFDAAKRFGLGGDEDRENPECISGLILQGVKKPFECKHFGKGCTPEHPLGATMVSSEGACAAYFKYRGR